MINKISSLVIIGILLLLPIQNVYAHFHESWVSDPIGSITKTVGELSLEEFEKNIPHYIVQFENENISNELYFIIISTLESVRNNFPDTFSNWLIEYPKIQKIINYYFENEINVELKKMPSEWKELGFDTAIMDITRNLDEYGQRNLKLVHATEMDVEGLEKPQGFVNESIILGAESILIFDFESKKVMTLDQYAKKLIENEPGLRHTDFATDPVRAGLMLIFDGEYLYVAPIIPVSESQYISLAQYCQLQLDEKKCEQAKILLKTASSASKAKDPTLFLHSTKAFLGIMNEINKEFGLGVDDEINSAQSIISITPEQLTNVKLIQINGKYVSINDASTINYREKEINLAQIALHELENPSLNDQQRIENIILILKIIDDINN